MNINSLISTSTKNVRKGFTILEILVVISVIAILITVAIPRFLGMQIQAKEMRAKKETKTVMQALEAYKMHHNLRSGPVCPSTVYPSGYLTLQKDYLVSDVPNTISSPLYDPLSSTPQTEYKYMSSADGVYYTIWSVGAPGDDQPIAVGIDGTIYYQSGATSSQ